MAGNPSARWAARSSPGMRLPRRLVITAGAMLLLGLVAVMAALPWMGGVATAVRHSYTATVPAENRGTYLVTSHGAMQLFAWSIDPGAFPADAPTLERGSVREVVVVLKQHGEPVDYRLFDLDRDTVVGWDRAGRTGMQLTLIPEEALDAGRYMLLAPTDSMFGGHTRHYFRIGDGQ